MMHGGNLKISVNVLIETNFAILQPFEWDRTWLSFVGGQGEMELNVKRKIDRLQMGYALPACREKCDW